MQQYYYKKLIERDIDAVNGVSASRSRLLNILMQLRKCCNHPYLFDGAEQGPPFINGPHLWENSGKMMILDKLLKRLKQQKSRVLIFSQMTRVLDLLEDYCWLQEYEYCRIDGSTDSNIRDDHIEAFNKPNSSKFIFLLSTRAGGLGINLATADIVILYDSDWNPQVDLQAQDRAHRIGQTKPVKVFRFITEKTVEERIIERATRKLKLDALVIQQGRLQEQSKALSKDDLIGMIKYGADEVLRAQGSTISDDDIDKILARGEQETRDIEEKMTKTAEESMYNFTMDGGMGSVYDWEEPKNEEDGKLELLTTWIEPSKRERKKNYNEDQYFKSQMQGTGGPKAPKLPKMPQTFDFQFYNSKRLTELIDKEKNAIISKWEITERSKSGEPPAEGAPTVEEQLAAIVEMTPEEIEEKEALLSEGFQEWSKRDFNNYVRACEKYGRSALEEVSNEVDGKEPEDVQKYHKTFWKRYKEIADYDRIIKKIEAGEDKIHRRLEIERILKSKVAQSKDPFNQLKLNYGQNKGKAFNEEEDRYMICMTEKLGYGNWEDLKAEIRAAWQFRFDWFIKSRTPTELGRRVDTLIRLIEKEDPGDHSGKRKGYDDGGGSSKKAKA
jgi:SWI/SNF-related matrix-associated actin-dependent regulator of chromatin subfamily A member 5